MKERVGRGNHFLHILRGDCGYCERVRKIDISDSNEANPGKHKTKSSYHSKPSLPGWKGPGQQAIHSDEPCSQNPLWKHVKPVLHKLPTDPEEYEENDKDDGPHPCGECDLAKRRWSLVCERSQPKDREEE